MTKDNEDALRCAEWLQAAVCTYPQTSKDKPGRYCSKADLEMDSAAAHLRRLVAENEALNHYRKVYGEVSAILACTAEMPPPSDDDEITVQRLKALVQHLEVYVDSCAAKADRIDRLGEAVVKLRSENEAKDALLRQAVEALELGRDALYEQAETYHQAMRGYRQAQHDAMDAEVRQADAAIAAIRQHLEGKA